MIYDLFIIGGGINGAGIANLASSLGYKTCLCEQYDFGSQTSASSTKLIHGGLRYLENYEFSLVKKALKERQVLHHLAPHIIWPLEFILIINPKIRNRWLIRLGLFIYDFLAGFNKIYNKTKHIILCDNILKSEFKVGYSYADLWADDSRLCLLNIKQADYNGADVYKNTKVINASFNNNLWDVIIENNKSQKNIKSKYIINASGPWVNLVLENIFNNKPKYGVKLIKGSHIILPKQYNHSKSYVLQCVNDNRIIFVIPYENDFTLIGTTEVDISDNFINHELSKKNIDITSEEIDYLINNYNYYFNKTINKNNIIHTYAGIRPLISEKNKGYSENTRDYFVDCYDKNKKLINIYGGKITTYRKLAIDVIKNMVQELSLYPNNHKCNEETLAFSNKLPGGDITNHESFIKKLLRRYSWLDSQLAYRYTRTYGSLSYNILQNCICVEDLGQNFGTENKPLYKKEVDYLIKEEYVNTAEDILWRRTKLGLYIKDDQELNNYIQQSINKNL